MCNKQTLNVEAKGMYTIKLINECFDLFLQSIGSQLEDLERECTKNQFSQCGNLRGSIN